MVVLQRPKADRPEFHALRGDEAGSEQAESVSWEPRTSQAVLKARQLAPTRYPIATQALTNDRLESRHLWYISNFVCRSLPTLRLQRAVRHFWSPNPRFFDMWVNPHM